MALVMMLVEVERVKMAVVCQSAGTTVHRESLQRDWIIQKCCVDFHPVVKLQLKVGLLSLLDSKWTSAVWKSQAVGHPQLNKMLAVLTLMQAPVHDEWKMALVTVLVEVERLKMALVCRTAGTVVHLE